VETERPIRAPLAEALAMELRRLFPGISDTARARECARIVATWKPLPLRTLSPPSGKRR